MPNRLKDEKPRRYHDQPRHWLGVEGCIATPPLPFRTEHESFQPHSAPARGRLSTIVRWITPLDLDPYYFTPSLYRLGNYLTVRSIAIPFQPGNYGFNRSPLYA